MKAGFVVACLALALTLAPAGAEGCVPTTTVADVDSSVAVTGVGRGYIDVDPPCDPECFWSIWIYEESNGIDGLQRADELHDDTCGGVIPPDSLIF